MQAYIINAYINKGMCMNVSEKMVYEYIGKMRGVIANGVGTMLASSAENVGVDGNLYMDVKSRIITVRPYGKINHANRLQVYELYATYISCVREYDDDNINSVVPYSKDVLILDNGWSVDEESKSLLDGVVIEMNAGHGFERTVNIISDFDTEEHY